MSKAVYGITKEKALSNMMVVSAFFNNKSTFSLSIEFLFFIERKRLMMTQYTMACYHSIKATMMYVVRQSVIGMFLDSNEISCCLRDRCVWKKPLLWTPCSSFCSASSWGCHQVLKTSLHCLANQFTHPSGQLDGCLILWMHWNVNGRRKTAICKP